MMHYHHCVEVSQMPVLAYNLKLQALEDVLTSVTFSQCLVFCNMVSKVETLCSDIKNWGFSTTYISSAKEQAARLRAIECLKRFKCKVLVTSDITSRGIDAENVDLIINVDVPYNTEVYLHRVGRAGRYGTKGVAITFISTSELESFRRIQKGGNFKSYRLPVPVPANLMNQRPKPVAKVVQEEDNSSGSDESSSSSSVIVQFDESLAAEIDDDTISFEVQHLNSQNSMNHSNGNNTVTGNKVKIVSQAAKLSTSKDYCKSVVLENDLDESSVLLEEKLGEEVLQTDTIDCSSKLEVEDNAQSHGPSSETEECIISKQNLGIEEKLEIDVNVASYGKHHDRSDGDESLINQQPEREAQVVQEEDNPSDSRDEASSPSVSIPSHSTVIMQCDEPLADGIDADTTSLETKVHHLMSQNSMTHCNGKNAVTNDTIEIVSQAVEFPTSEDSCKGVLENELSVTLEEELVIPEGKEALQTAAMECNSKLKDNAESLESSSETEDSKQPISVEEELEIGVNVVNYGKHDDGFNSENVVTTENDNLATENENLNLPVTVTFQNKVNEAPINLIVEEGSKKIISRDVNNGVTDVSVVNVEDKSVNASDLEANLITDEGSTDNGNEKCVSKKGLDSKGSLDTEVPKQKESIVSVAFTSDLDCLDNGEEKTDKVLCSPVVHTKSTISKCADEITTCVVNFIGNYEKKSAGDLSGVTIGEKQIRLTSKKHKLLNTCLSLDRGGLNDYYYKVFQAYKNGYIAENSVEQLKVTRDESGVTSVGQDDECFVLPTKKDVLPLVEKIDLSSWSKKLLNINSIKNDSYLTDESDEDSSSEYMLTSSPKAKVSRAKSTLLDVSSDTPPLLHSVDDPETDDFLSSRYSNKCLKLENARKNKNGIINKKQASSELTESSTTVLQETESSSALKSTMCESASSSDSGSSSSGESSFETTLLEKAFRKMAQTNSKPMSLSEQAEKLKETLHGMKGKGAYLSEVSDIRITKVPHSSAKPNSSDNGLNSLQNKYPPGFPSLPRCKTNVSRSESSDGGVSSKASCSAVKSFVCDKGLNTCRGKFQSGSQPLVHYKTAESNKKSSSISEYSSDIKMPKKGVRSSAKSFGSNNGLNVPRGKCPSVLQSSLCCEASSDSERSISRSSSSTHVQQRRSKLKKESHRQASLQHAEISHSHFNRPQNSRHINDYHSNQHGAYPSQGHNSCSWPSQHQCHYINGNSSCQSQLCASWYEIFYRQWNCIQNAYLQ